MVAVIGTIRITCPAISCERTTVHVVELVHVQQGDVFLTNYFCWDGLVQGSHGDCATGKTISWKPGICHLIED